jgi:hypothetical protein
VLFTHFRYWIMNNTWGRLCSLEFVYRYPRPLTIYNYLRSVQILKFSDTLNVLFLQRTLQLLSPYGVWSEYLHRSPASRTGRRKGSLKSERVKYDLRWRVPTAIVYNRCDLSLERESAPTQQTRNCLDSNKNLVVSPRWMLYSKTDWSTDRRS